MKELDDITGLIVNTAFQIHQGLGPGLLETVYESVLFHELERMDLKVERQKTVSFEFNGRRYDEGLRLDLLVENRVVLEIKSTEKTSPVHYKQLLTYIRLLDLRVGLLINFGTATMKEGLHRVVNHLSPSASPRLRVNQSSPQEK